MIGYADGDARRLLNMLEQIAVAAESGGRTSVDEAFVKKALTQNLRRFDKGGDVFYDQISALHKSVRGSSPDAALYWLTRMLDGGADPLYLARRMVRMAVEDVGLADPRALRITLDAAETYERLGSPEGELALAEAVIYLAVTPKSNAVYTAYGAAAETAQRDTASPVPLHLRNAPTKLMKQLDYGKGYRYAHDDPEAVADMDCLPEDLQGREFYRPTDRGFEKEIKRRLDGWKELKRRRRAAPESSE